MNKLIIFSLLSVTITAIYAHGEPLRAKRNSGASSASRGSADSATVGGGNSISDGSSLSGGSSSGVAGSSGASSTADGAASSFSSAVNSLSSSAGNFAGKTMSLFGQTTVTPENSGKSADLGGKPKSQNKPHYDNEEGLTTESTLIGKFMSIFS